jgi:ATP-dependent DNA helicase RecQ
MHTESVQARVVELLQQTFRHREFRPGQRAVIDALLQLGGSDQPLGAAQVRGLLAVLPPGGGKSLCYQLPALLLDGLTVVVSPLLSLMKDQVDGLRRLGVAAERADSSLGAGEAAATLERVRLSCSAPSPAPIRLLYVSPERFVSEGFSAFLRSVPLAMVAVDEAHCLSEWGPNFRPDCLRVAEVIQRLARQPATDRPPLRVLALTATATPEVRLEICRHMHIAPQSILTGGFTQPALTLSFCPVPRSSRDAVLLIHLQTRPPGAGIIYVNRQETAERVAQFLRRAGIEARPYHAGFSEEARTEIQEWWARSPVAFVVATLAFGVGIHKPDIRYVYHYDLPRSLEGFAQEVGRAGRDGGPALAEVLGAQEEVAWLENHILGDTPSIEVVSAVVRELTSGGGEFSLDLAGLARRTDLRPSVLRTLLIRLETMHLIQPGTPWFSTWKVHPTRPLEDILRQFDRQFDAARATFLRRLFSTGERAWGGWYTISPVISAEHLGEDRDRICRALYWMARQNLIEIRRSDLQLSYIRTGTVPDPDALARKLLYWLVEREAVEVQRVHEVIGLITAPSCQTVALWRHLGEHLDGPCGRCSFCLSGRVALPALPPPIPAGEGIDLHALHTLYLDHPGALGSPRQLARFLCGLSSPATVAARLIRHGLFGCRSEWAFDEVLGFCEGLPVQMRKAA